MKFTKFAAIIAAIPMFFACEKPFPGTASYIKVEGPKEYEVPCEGLELQLNVDTDGKTLNCNPDVAWITCSYTYDKVLTIKVKTNPTKYDREGNVIISYKGVDDYVINFRQAKSDIEVDPYIPEEGYYAPWDASWPVSGFIYKLSGRDKYEPLMYGENGLPASERAGYNVHTADKITIGVKLEQPMLDYFRGKSIIGMELNLGAAAKSVKFAFVEVAKEENDANAPAWQKGKLLSQTNVIWESEEITDLGAWSWPNVSIESGLAALPINGDVMCVAYIEADDAADKGVIFTYNQHISQIAPCYLSTTGSDGKNMFLFSGGTIPFNLYFSQQ